MKLYKNSLVGQIFNSRPLLLAAIGRDSEQRLVAKTLFVWATGDLGRGGTYPGMYRRGWVERALQLKQLIWLRG